MTAATRVKIACRALPFQPLAIARSDIRGRPGRFRSGDATRLQRGAAHDHSAFEQLALGEREVEPVSSIRCTPVVSADHHRRLGKGIAGPPEGRPG